MIEVDRIEDDQPAFRDPALPVAERVRDLLGRMTRQEKIGQMTNDAAAVPRLGIPAYNFWSEALHGVARNGRATVFPQAIGMAATWDTQLVRRIASAIADEGRAKHHEAARRNGSTGQYQGLTFWSPNVNLFRDPRWGRGQETWGEDPFLTGEMGAAFVQGLQGDHPRYLKAAACAKHFAVHSGPEKLRHSFDARVSPRELYDTYLPAFKRLVDAGVEAVMCAYNRTNGEPCCASPTLLTGILRGKWGFAGHVVSDCWALSNVHNEHGMTRDAAETAALALKAGCDISCMCTYDHLDEAIRRGLIAEADVDRALERTLATRFKLGMFDPADMVPYAATPLEVVGCAAHRALARDAAARSVVLLKNAGQRLPIGAGTRSLMVVGPAAGDIPVLLGNYHGASAAMATLLEGIVARAPEGVRVEYRPGCLWTTPAANPINWSINEAAAADLTLACMGLSPLLEGEEGESLLTAENGDRADIALPQAQVDYLKQLAAAGARVVLLLTGGSPLALDEVADLVEAIVRYMRSEPLYPFGFGLSYTRFEYGDLQLARRTLAAGETLALAYTLRNAGDVEAEEVAQVYLSDLQASVPVPLHKLAGFERVRLAPGEQRRLHFQITPAAMALIDEHGAALLEPGTFRVTVGGCSPGERGPALGAPRPLSADFVVQV